MKPDSEKRERFPIGTRVVWIHDWISEHHPPYGARGEVEAFSVAASRTVRFDEGFGIFSIDAQNRLGRRYMMACNQKDLMLEKEFDAMKERESNG